MALIRIILIFNWFGILPFTKLRFLLSRRHIFFLLFSVTCLLVGGGNYFLYRGQVLFLQFMHMPGVGITIRNSVLRAFMTGYFSDILWCCSLCAFTLVLWEKGHLTLWNNVIILSVPFVLEIAQKLTLIPGTFDWLDCFLYALIELIFLLAIFKKEIP